MRKNTLPFAGILRFPQVSAIYTVFTFTRWKSAAGDRYPGPVKTGPLVTAWRDGDMCVLIVPFLQKGGA